MATEPLPVEERRPEVLLLPNIPKPLHGVAPREILGRKWWDAARKAAYESTGQRCIACGVHKSQAKSRKWVEGHEEYDTDYLLGRLTYLRTIPLCHFCHNFIHSGRLQALLDRGEVHQAKYVGIIQHGERILAEAGLSRPDPYEGPIADWGDWRLVIDGKEYPGKFKTFEEWRDYYASTTDKD